MMYSLLWERWLMGSLNQRAGCSSCCSAMMPAAAHFPDDVAALTGIVRPVPRSPEKPWTYGASWNQPPATRTAVAGLVNGSSKVSSSAMETLPIPSRRDGKMAN